MSGDAARFRIASAPSSTVLTGVTPDWRTIVVQCIGRRQAKSTTNLRGVINAIINNARPHVDTVDFDPEAMDATDLYKILCGAIVPRPIGLISTRSATGLLNVAPFSFFNAISHIPPLVCVSIAPTFPEGRRKDTLSNMMETREFVA